MGVIIARLTFTIKYSGFGEKGRRPKQEIAETTLKNKFTTNKKIVSLADVDLPSVFDSYSSFAVGYFLAVSVPPDVWRRVAFHPATYFIICSTLGYFQIAFSFSVGGLCCEIEQFV